MTLKQLRKQQARHRAGKRRLRRKFQLDRRAVLKANRRAKRAAKAAPRKSLAAWSKTVRTCGVCEVCGATENLQAHHLLPRERYPFLKLEPMNGISLCPTCHKWGKYSAHRNPIWFTLFIKKHCSERYNWVKANL